MTSPALFAIELDFLTPEEGQRAVLEAELRDIARDLRVVLCVQPRASAQSVSNLALRVETLADRVMGWNANNVEGKATHP